MKTYEVIIAILIITIIWIFGFTAGRESVDSTTKGPGTRPADVFHDGGEWYSQDGCWHLQDGYWRPLRRCNIVRVPAP